MPVVPSGKILRMVALCGEEAEDRGGQLFMQRSADIPGIEDGLPFRNTRAWGI
jgi:hypothetical protein